MARSQCSGVVSWSERSHSVLVARFGDKLVFGEKAVFGSYKLNSVFVGAIYWYVAAMWVLALVIHGRREKPLCTRMYS